MSNSVTEPNGPVTMCLTAILITHQILHVSAMYCNIMAMCSDTTHTLHINREYYDYVTLHICTFPNIVLFAADLCKSKLLCLQAMDNFQFFFSFKNPLYLMFMLWEWSRYVKNFNNSFLTT